jgi:hypothetical protein
MDNALIKFDSAVVCDDVRTENTGKNILIGVVSSDLGFPEFPANTMLTVYAEGEVLRAGVISLEVTIIDDLGGVLFNSPRGPIAHLVLGRFYHIFRANFTLQRECTISVVARDLEQENVVLSRRVRKLNIEELPPELKELFGAGRNPVLPPSM